MSLAPARLHASIVLAITRGHNSAQTLWSYFKPARRYTALEPATAWTVWPLSERSQETTWAAPGVETGFRATSLNGSLRAASSLTSSLLIAPPAPRIVIIWNPPLRLGSRVTVEGSEIEVRSCFTAPSFRIPSPPAPSLQGYLLLPRLPSTREPESFVRSFRRPSAPRRFRPGWSSAPGFRRGSLRQSRRRWSQFPCKPSTSGPAPAVPAVHQSPGCGPRRQCRSAPLPWLAEPELCLQVQTGHNPGPRRDAPRPAAVRPLPNASLVTCFDPIAARTGT